MKKLLWLFFLLAVAFVAAGLALPTQVHVERSIAVNRPAATVFTLLNGFRTFNRWSPWTGLDPGAEYRFSGPATGVGARMEWSGDPALVGTGWQEITGSQPYRRVGMHLDFGPQGVAESYFEIAGDSLGSRVTWGFDTDVTEGQGFLGGLLGRYFGLFLDRWVGADYENGLASFKVFAESLPPQDFSLAAIEELDVQPVGILYVAGDSSQDPAEIAAALGSAYGEVMAFITRNAVEIAGQPMVITRAWEGGRYRFDAAVPVATKIEDPAGRVRYGLSPHGPAVKIVHTGPYETTGESYALLSAYLAAHGLEEGEVSWEHYISDPGQTPENELVTDIYIQVVDGD